MDRDEIRPRVLIAEDEAIIRLDLVETLRELGYDVVAAVGDGAKAIELAGDTVGVTEVVDNLKVEAAAPTATKP